MTAPFSRRRFLQTSAGVPAIAGASMLAGLVGSLHAPEANATGPVYRLRKTEMPFSAPMRNAYPGLNSQTAGINVLAYNAGANNSPICSSAASGFPATYAVNGNESGKVGQGSGVQYNVWWKSATPNAPPGTDWVGGVIPTWSLGGTPALKEVVVVSVQDDPVNAVIPNDTTTGTLYVAANFLVQTSTDGLHWTTVATVRNNNKIRCRVPVAYPRGKNVRVLFDLAPGYGGYNRVVEIEAYTADAIIYPFTYDSIAAATADGARLKSWEDFMLSGCTYTDLQYFPLYTWDVIDESSADMQRSAVTNLAPSTDSRWVPLQIVDKRPGPLALDLLNMSLDEIGNILGMTGIGVWATVAVAIGPSAGLGVLGSMTLIEALAVAGFAAAAAMGLVVAIMLIAVGVYVFSHTGNPRASIPSSIDPRVNPGSGAYSPALWAYQVGAAFKLGSSSIIKISIY